MSKCPGDTRRSFRMTICVLLSLQTLHGIPSFHCGARLSDILSVVKKHCLTDGDVENQVKTALKHCIREGFIEKRCDKYLLIAGVAKIQKLHGRDHCRKKEICRAKKIYPFNWKKSSVTNNCGKVCPITERAIASSQCVTKDKGVQFSVCGCTGYTNESSSSSCEEEESKDCPPDDSKESKVSPITIKLCECGNKTNEDKGCNDPCAKPKKKKKRC